MKKLVLLGLCLALLLPCLPARADNAAPGATYEDYIGKRFSILVGSLFDEVADRVFDASEKLYFNNTVEEIEAVRLGKTDAALLDRVAASQSLQAGSYDDLAMLPVPVEGLDLAYGAFSSKADIIAQYNAFLAEIKADGTLADMQARWLEAYAYDAVMPDIPLTGENGTLTVAIMATYPPFTFLGEDGAFAGFDIEQMRRFAAWLGMDVRFVDMDFGALIAYVASGKADIAGSVYITDERKEVVLFGEPDYISSTVLVVRKEGAAAPAPYDAYLGTGKVFGNITGDVYGMITRTAFGASETQEYDTVADGIIALRNGRIDAFAADSIDLWLPERRNELNDIEFIPIPPEIHTNELSQMFATEALQGSFNEFLAALKADGTLDAMYAFWFTGDDLPAEDTLPHIDLPGGNGTLRATMNPGNAPLTYADASGRFTGYAVELTERFAQHLGMDVAWIPCDMLTGLSYLQSGKSDIFAAMSTKTESRMEQHFYGDTVLLAHPVLIVRRAADAAPAATRDYTWFAGMDLGVHIGSITDTVVTEMGATPVYFPDSSPAIEATRNGRVAGLCTDLSALRILVADPGNEDLEIIEVPASFFTGPMGAISTFDSKPLMDEFNAFVATLRADGTLDDMQARWFSGVPDLNAPMPDLAYTGERGTLKVATVDTDIPFGYVGDKGELKGYSVELMNRFAADAGYLVEYLPMEFGALIPAVVGGRASMAISSISITEERQKSVLFSDPIFDDHLGIVTLKASADAQPAVTYENFIGKTFAIKNGTIYDGISSGLMQSASTLFFEDYPSIYEAIKTGRVDAGMRGYTAAYVSLFEPAYADLAVISLPETLHTNPVGAISMDQGVIDAFNAFLAAIKADGTYDDMHARWFDTFTPDNIPAMPDIPLTGEGGTLTVAISSDYMPFSFLGDNGKNMGFDIELARRFAQHTGRDIAFVDMAFSGLLPYVVSGKADLAISDISITAERAKSVLFTEPYFYDLSGLIYRRDFGAAVQAEAPQGAMAWLKNAVQRNLITENRWRMIVDGLGVTMTISFLAQLLGTAFGCFLCWVLLRKNRLASGLGRLFSGLIHGVPMVVLLMISYYVIFGRTDISAVLIAVCAFALVEGAGIAANLKGAIDTVDPVEIEAARSIGFSAFGAFRTVTLPQAIKRALPAYCNGFIQLVKATAIVGYIAIQDMTRAGDIIRSRTYDAYFPLLFVALIYLLVTTLCVQLFKLIVKRINKETQP